MTAVLLQLKRLQTNASPEQRRQLDEAQEVVKASLDDVRRLAQELRPEVLDHLGLASALENARQQLRAAHAAAVQSNSSATCHRSSPGAELVIYRIAQESLTNVARHAQASEVLLSLERGNGSVVLRVVDDGQGFAPDHVEGGGLRGIRERALIVGGAAAIKPGSHGGVEVRLEVPVGTT